MFYAADGIWEVRASRKHTNLTRRIDPPTPKDLKSPKLKNSGFPQIIFLDTVVILCLFVYVSFLYGSRMAPRAKTHCGTDS